MGGYVKLSELESWKYQFCLKLSWKWQIPIVVSPLQLPHSAMNENEGEESQKDLLHIIVPF